jgi:hypothetical protein
MDAGTLLRESRIEGMERLSWKIDVLIYRLFYWRWSPRLKRDPDLAYMFSKIGAAWTNGNPPTNPALVDQVILDTFAKHGKAPNIIQAR